MTKVTIDNQCEVAYALSIGAKVISDLDEFERPLHSVSKCMRFRRATKKI